MAGISVIVPVRNGADVLGRCLEALSNQTLSKDQYEVIVVDDGSTDSSRTIGEAKADRVIRQEAQGPATARNAGAQAATGEIIVFTDADCVADTNFLEKLTKPLRENPDIVGAKGTYTTTQTSLAARFAHLEFEDRYDLLERQLHIDFVDSYAAAFRRNVFLDIGGFDGSFPTADNEDVDLSFRMAERGPMVFVRGATVEHRHPNSLLSYLRKKLSRGYWRMKVYKRFPEKAVKDSYTPQVLKLQILLAGFIVFSLLGTLVNPLLAVLDLTGIAAFLITTLPFVLKGLRKDPLVAVLSPSFIFLRSVVLGVGALGGMIVHRNQKVGENEPRMDTGKH